MNEPEDPKVLDKVERKKFLTTKIMLIIIPDEPPPSYESLYGKIKRAKVESDNNVGFFRTVAGLLFASGMYRQFLHKLHVK